jgi:hypothetical protein
MRRRALLALVLIAGAVPAAAAPTLDAFVCYGARRAPGAPRFPGAGDAETPPPAPVPGTHRVDTFHCYGIAAAPGFARGAQIVVGDALGGRRSLEVVRPRNGL